MVAAAWVWARRELSRRAPAALALVLLIGLSFGVVLTAAAGARRTTSAFERFTEAAAASHLRVQLDEADLPTLLDALAEHPAVERATPYALFVAASDVSDLDIGLLTSPGRELLHTIEQPRVLAGRLPSPTEASEVAVNEAAAADLGVGVGDRLELSTFTPDQLMELVTTERFTGMDGPRLDLSVVGIARLPDDVANQDAAGMVYGTPALLERHRGDIGGFLGNVAVRLHDGADAPAVQAAVDDLGLEGVEVSDQRVLQEKLDASTRVMGTGLVAFTVAAALAALVATTQAGGRLLAELGPSQPALGAMGMTRRERTVGAVLVVAAPILGGALLAVVVAVLASPLMPVGLARRAEPAPGIDVDGVVLAAGALAVAVIALLAATWSAARLVRVASAGGSTTPLRRRRSAGAAVAARAGAHPPAVLGITMALEAGRGRTAVPVRPALVGVAVGVAGVVGALCVDASLGRLADSPAEYGWTWDAAPDFEAGRFEELAEVDVVDDLGELSFAGVELGGQQVQGASLRMLQGSITFALREGRMPVAPTEVVVGPADADRLDVEVGDEVPVGSGPAERDLTVVGVALFPVMDDRPMDSGALLVPTALDELAFTDGFQRPVLTWAPGRAEAEAITRFEAAFPGALSPYSYPSPPSEVSNVVAVDAIPRALAAFLFLLALAAAAHALVSTVRRRRHDLAVVHVIGFTARQVRRSVLWQAATLALTGALVGLPLGVAAGRTVWRVLAADVGVFTAPVVPPVTVAIATAAIALAVVALGVVPAAAAGRARPAEGLRTE